MRQLLFTAAALAVAAPAVAEDVEYEVGGEAYSGYYASAEEPKGLVVIIHDWDGLNEYERRRADMLAELGYDAFAVDLFGAGNRPETVEARRAATGALRDDRERMRALISGGLAAAREQSGAGSAVVMGYCFGGGAALELARSGQAEDVAGYASFHGNLATPEGQSWPAEAPPVQVLHGGADESVSMDEFAGLVRELEEAGVVYEAEVYSGAPHGFTEWESDRYQERADELSWEAFRDFLDRNLTAQS
jgi:dienelactone hydrolase